ncbi:hypothetical protein V3C99_013112 [Haemonchus contortus]
MNNEVSQNNIARNKLTFPLPTNFGEELAELSKTNPMLCGSMEKLYKNITAMESDLEAKYLFFSKIIENFKNSKQNITGYDNPALILEKALHSVPEESRKTIGDFLSFNEHGNGTGYQMSVHTNVSAGTNHSACLVCPRPRDDLDVELRKSLKTIETILIVANNSLPYGLQRNDSFTLFIHVIRMTRTRCNPLTFEDIKPIFLALKDTSYALGRILRPNIPYQQNRADPFELEFAVVVLYDTLQKLHKIANNLHRDCGELLKTYFEYYLSGGMRFSAHEIAEYSARIGRVASAARFC